MKPSLEQLSAACPDVPREFVAQHLTRLDDRYFDCFDLAAVAGHTRALAVLDSSTPATVSVQQQPDRLVAVTVLAFDYAHEFSLLTGILAGLGLSVESGAIFTYRRAESGRTTKDLDTRRRIIDRFTGTIGNQGFATWKTTLEQRLLRVIRLLEDGDDEKIEQARLMVNEWVAAHLATAKLDARSAFYPVDISIDLSLPQVTRLNVIGQDTPAFLYALTNALSLHDIRIEQVAIDTVGQVAEDTIDVVDARGRKIDDAERLNQIKLSVLLTKQFTYFLVQAPDPYAALCRFEQLVDRAMQAPSRGQWLEVLSNPRALQDLARVLGASDFLWEDFIRQQYETLLPMLAPHIEGRRFSASSETLAERLETALDGADTYEELRTRLNNFKDREIFLIDLDHIVNPEVDFRTLAARLTQLAELVIERAAEVVYAHLAERFGVPRTVAGVETPYALLGLGKFGGAALGYASDIELLFVYSDGGTTDGRESLDSGEFFHRMVREMTHFIQAKREGIFALDLRLRPHGNAGPLAASLESFCRYYGPDGGSHAYERLALVRLRACGGDATLGARVERLRDELVYAAGNIDLAAIRDLRRKQCAEKTKGGTTNAKFSPGGLVDVEYDVQILQVMHGADTPALRTPRIHEALTCLAAAGVLEAAESRQLTAAYDFLRRLINSMRMLRGSAKDLFLPLHESYEFGHLARRMGYRRRDGVSPAQQLHLDFETHTAIVRAFVERHFGRAALPTPTAGTVADVVVSDEIDVEARTRILHDAGFADPQIAYRFLRSLAGSGASREMFARLAVLACDCLGRLPDPDMALRNWERFSAVVPDREDHFATLLAQPARLEVLMHVFAGSQFLSDALVRNPEFFEWVTSPATLHAHRMRAVLEDELRALAEEASDHADWRNALRRFRRREMLRIGIRDTWLHVPLENVVAEISALAEAITAVALERVWEIIMAGIEDMPHVTSPANHFCLLAFGKLGGGELNYSSDIDVMGLCDDVAFSVTLHDGRTRAHKELYAHVLDLLRADLADHTEEGYAYRVDFRLRPYGGSGELVPSVTALVEYYHSHAGLWEVQAALKLRAVAGNRCIGTYFLTLLEPVILHGYAPEKVAASIAEMRRKAVHKAAHALDAGVDIKNGEGGIRDIEFLVQGLQLIHAPARPEVLTGNTLTGLRALRAAGILDEDSAESLERDYIFLRRVEHFLQILEDRQIHSLPRAEAELTALARRVLGCEATADDLQARVLETRKRVHTAVSVQS